MIGARRYSGETGNTMGRWDVRVYPRWCFAWENKSILWWKQGEPSTCDKRHFIRWQCKIGPWLYTMTCRVCCLLYWYLSSRIHWRAHTHSILAAQKSKRVWKFCWLCVFYCSSFKITLTCCCMQPDVFVLTVCHTGIKFGPHFSDIECSLLEYSLFCNDF